MAVVTELDLATIGFTSPELTGERLRGPPAELRGRGWLAGSSLAFVMLDREPGDLFLRSRETAFAGREIADLFGIRNGPLREHVDANILNQRGERHRRLRALAGPALTPRAADRWRPVMREFLGLLRDQIAAAGPAVLGGVEEIYGLDELPLSWEAAPPAA